MNSSNNKHYPSKCTSTLRKHTQSTTTPIPTGTIQTRRQMHVDLITNAYSVETLKSNSTINEYSISISLSEGFKGFSAQLLFRNPVSRGIRKILMKDVIPQLLDSKYSEGSVVIGQSLENIYSFKLFKHQIDKNANDEIFEFEKLLVEADLLCKIYVDIQIKYVRTFSLLSEGQNHTLLSSILHHQLWLNMIRYGSVYFASRQKDLSFAQPTRLDLISEHIRGISISGIRKCAKDQSIVVINCPHSYLTESHRLIDLLASFIAEHPVQLSHRVENASFESHLIKEIRSINGTEDWFRSFTAILNGFKCQVIGQETSVNLRFTLSSEPASSLRMKDDKITVVEHYRQLGTNINYPNLPCLKSRFNEQLYYPLEMCSLLPEQKVPIFRLSTAARNHLVQLNKPKPDLSKKSSSEARSKVESICHSQFRKFGFKLNEAPVEATGSILTKPYLQFKEQSLEPQRDFWESGKFYQAVHLTDNWCVVDTIEVNQEQQDHFFYQFSCFSRKFGFNLGRPHYLHESKQNLLEDRNAMNVLIEKCLTITRGNLRLIMFVIDSSSTSLNRLIHLSFDDQPAVTATCLRLESIMNRRQHYAIYRTLVHKLNARLGGTNVVYETQTLAKLNLSANSLMVIGLDVTHPDNELSGVSIVGCAYTYDKNLFRHRSLVWPQVARVEIISKMDALMRRVLQEYYSENNGRLPAHLIIYRDGVSHEEFDRVKKIEVEKVQNVLIELSRETGLKKPNLSYIIAQKRHTMRFFKQVSDTNFVNPPGGTIIDQDVVCKEGEDFYLYSNTGPHATARPLHYHVFLSGMPVDSLKKLTYFLCFNFGKCSGTLTMPSSLKYAHNAAYDARNRVISSREFQENRFYSSKFFC